jgi:hypothetical protein
MFLSNRFFLSWSRILAFCKRKLDFYGAKHGRHCQCRCFVVIIIDEIAIYSEFSSNSIVANMQRVFEIAGRTNNRLVADRADVRTVLLLCARKLAYTCADYSHSLIHPLFIINYTHALNSSIQHIMCEKREICSGGQARRLIESAHPVGMRVQTDVCPSKNTPVVPHLLLFAPNVVFRRSLVDVFVDCCFCSLPVGLDAYG